MLLSGSKVYQVLLISPLRANNVLAAVVPFRTDKLWKMTLLLHNKNIYIYFKIYDFHAVDQKLW